MATIVTTAHLDLVAEGPVIAIHQPDSVLDSMDDWNKRTHGASGLIERVRESKYTLASAEKRTLEVLTVLVGLLGPFYEMPMATRGVMWLAATFTIVSGLQYIVQGMRFLNTVHAEESHEPDETPLFR